jgi:predicted MarR family transcription regulator
MKQSTDVEDPAKDEAFSPVTSWHLAKTPLEAATTELEWALLRWREAFDRYNLHALNMLGLPGMGVSETLVLHIVRLHDRPKPANMIASLLNRDDIQNVQYTLRKLMSAGLIEKDKNSSGKNTKLTATDKGRHLCDELANIRAQLVVSQVAQLESGESRLLYSAKTVSMLTGLYDEAGRTSTAYTLQPESPAD